MINWRPAWALFSFAERATMSSWISFFVRGRNPYSTISLLMIKVDLKKMLLQPFLDIAIDNSIVLYLLRLSGFKIII